METNKMVAVLIRLKAECRQVAIGAAALAGQGLGTVAGWAAGLLAGLLLLALPLGSVRAEEPRVLRCRMVARDFMAELRDGIQSVFRDQGPGAAVSACCRLVPELSARYSLPPGLDLRLVALDCCDPDNRADEWEKQGLERFLRQRRAGAVLAGLEFWQEVGTARKRRFRYLRALPAGSLCLQCHGERLSPKIRRALQAAGTDYQRQGDRLGELRGALSLTLSP